MEGYSREIVEVLSRYFPEETELYHENFSRRPARDSNRAPSKYGCRESRVRAAVRYYPNPHVQLGNVHHSS
jgi:hypothetical protein